MNHPMNDEQEKQKIRDVITTWIRATAAGDLDQVLSLMTEDVVFLRPGQPPMCGREAYATASRPATGKLHIEGKPEIQEIHLAGEYAFCWNHLALTVTQVEGGKSSQHAGHILSVFRHEPDGRWLLFRDANMLVPV